MIMENKCSQHLGLCNLCYLNTIQEMDISFIATNNN